MVAQFRWWFGGGSDETIGTGYAALTERAARGELDGWADAPRSRLALIIVLDQFSRSLYRNTPRAFAQDPKALGLTLAGLENGHYAALETPWEKTFFFLPLGHSEYLPYQERAVTLAEELVVRPRNSGRSWNTRRRRLARIATSSRVSGVILIGT